MENQEEVLVYSRPESLTTTNTHYCPGCTHGVAHHIIAEVLDEMGLREQTIGVASVGCSVFAYNYFNFDFVQAPHGRAPAMATGIKRVFPERIVLTYQGDGDLASIGMAEIVHAAARGENISVFFLNNANYGMTGGQMAPTTLAGQKTSTSPYGRNAANDGLPIRMAELLAQLEGTTFSARVAVNSPRHVLSAAKVIRQAFQVQVENRGFSFVEILSTCPTNWGMSPLQANERVATEMIPYFPLGTFKNRIQDETR